MAKKQRVRIASLLERSKEKGGGVYLKLDVDVEVTQFNGQKLRLPKGTPLNVDDFRATPGILLEKGLINEEVAEEMQKKADAAPSYVKKHIVYSSSN